MPEKTQSLRPRFKDVQAHYDLSDDFFELSLDPTWTYSCAYFERDDMTLKEAQSPRSTWPGKLGLQPGMCCSTSAAVGGGDAARVGEIRRQRHRPDAEQEPGCLRRAAARGIGSPRSKRVLLEGWEQFHQPVDRIVAIGPLEHFGYGRYAAFFQRAYDLLPGDGTMLLHTIMQLSTKENEERKLPVTMRHVRFFKFIMDEIFPGGRLPTVALVEEHATKVGFTISRIQRLQPHYARTLDMWAAALQAHKDEAIAIQSEEVYDRYMKYLTGRAELFRDGYTDLSRSRWKRDSPISLGRGLREHLAKYRMADRRRAPNRSSRWSDPGRRMSVRTAPTRNSQPARCRR